MNCFWIYIFDKIPTGNFFIIIIKNCCELLLNLYLWQDSNRHVQQFAFQEQVVNCFWIYIFDKIPTGRMLHGKDLEELWIAFEFISLTRFQQVSTARPSSTSCCELLLNLYLWQDSNRVIWIYRLKDTVCSAQMDTARSGQMDTGLALERIPAQRQ